MYSDVSWFRVLRVSSKPGERKGREERSQSALAGTRRVHGREGTVMIGIFLLLEAWFWLDGFVLWCDACSWTWTPRRCLHTVLSVVVHLQYA